MHGAGVKRLVAVTSSAMAPTPSRSAVSSSSRCCSRTSSTSSAGRSTTTCAGWRRLVAASDLIWTIVRPSGLVLGGRGVRLPRRARPRRPPLHDPHRSRRLPAARGGRGPPPTHRDRRGDAERPPVDAVIDLAGRDPQAVMTTPPATTTPSTTCGGPTADECCNWRCACCRTSATPKTSSRRRSPASPASTRRPSTIAEGWLVVVTGRLCLDRLRTRRRHPADPWPGSAEAPIRAATPAAPRPTRPTTWPSSTA